MTQIPGAPGDSTPGDPFGGFDLGAVLQQAQAVQSQLVQAQQELAEATVEGSAGGVSVTLDGTGELTAVQIRPGAADASDEESWTDLGDLVVAAYRDAKSKVDELAAQTLGPLAGGGGLDLGGMFGGPGGGAGGGAAGGGELGGSGDARRSGF